MLSESDAVMRRTGLFEFRTIGVLALVLNSFCLVCCDSSELNQTETVAAINASSLPVEARSHTDDFADSVLSSLTDVILIEDGGSGGPLVLDVNMDELAPDDLAFLRSIIDHVEGGRCWTVLCVIIFPLY